MIQDISGVPKVRDHMALSRDLKASKGFGFHGCSFGEATRHAAGADNPFFYGHFFVADEETRRLDGLEFYKRLAASLSISLGYGSRWKIKDGLAAFEESPCLILMTPREGSECFLKSDTPMRETVTFSDAQFTFPIKHDAVRSIFNLEVLTYPSLRLNSLNSRLARKYTNYDDITKSYLVLRDYVGYFINQVHRKVLENAYQVRNS